MLLDKKAIIKKYNFTTRNNCMDLPHLKYNKTTKIQGPLFQKIAKPCLTYYGKIVRNQQKPLYWADLGQSYRNIQYFLDSCKKSENFIDSKFRLPQQKPYFGLFQGQKGQKISRNNSKPCHILTSIVLNLHAKKQKIKQFNNELAKNRPKISRNKHKP